MPPLKRSVYEDCVNCTGAGVVKTVESMSIDVMRLLALASHREDVRRVSVGVCQAVATYLNNRKRREITRIEAEANMTIQIRTEPDAPLPSTCNSSASTATTARSASSLRRPRPIAASTEEHDRSPRRPAFCEKRGVETFVERGRFLASNPRGGGA